MRRFLMALGTATVFAGTALAQVAINESDYQNPGTDSTEWVELVGKAGTDLSGWSLVLINQVNSVYATHTLPSGSIIPNDFASQWGGNGGFFVIGRFDATTAAGFGSPDYTPAGWNTDVIQNGPDDVIQLYDATGNLVDEWEYDNSAAGSVTGQSQPFEAFDSAGTAGNLSTYSSIGHIGYQFSQPVFRFDLPHGVGSVANDRFDHETNVASFWASTPLGPVTEGSGAEIVWSGTSATGADRGLSPGTFNHGQFGGMDQDTYTINIVPEPSSLLLLGLAAVGLIRRR